MNTSAPSSTLVPTEVNAKCRNERKIMKLKPTYEIFQSDKDINHVPDFKIQLNLLTIGFYNVFVGHHNSNNRQDVGHNGDRNHHRVRRHYFFMPK